MQETYSKIPSKVKYNNCICPNAKLLYGEITSLSDKYGYCYASNKYFAELYGVTVTTISLLIKNLVEKIESRPYDVLNSEEAREEAGDNEMSLYRIIKPEIDFPVGTSEYDPRVYERAAENFQTHYV